MNPVDPSRMRCVCCGRHLRRAAGMTERGPVGPVCAVDLGLPRPVPRLRKDGFPRAKSVRVKVRGPRRRLDPAQMLLEFAC